MHARHLATVAHDIPQLIRLLQREGDPTDLHVAYEAGPTGFGLYRRLRESSRRPSDDAKELRRKQVRTMN